MEFDDGISAAVSAVMDERWIPVRGVSYGGNGLLQLGQLLKDPYQPSTALIAPEQLRDSFPPEIGEQTVQNADVGPFGALLTTVVPFMPPRYLSFILQEPPAHSYTTGISLRGRRKLFIVTGIRIARPKISNDDFVFAYKVGELHYKKGIWIEPFTPSQKVDTVSDLLRLYEGVSPGIKHTEDRWVLISIIFHF